MDNGNGFKTMSQHADADADAGVGEQNDAGNSGITPNLKSFGVDTKQMSEAANERVSELQELLMEEIRAQPLRALGWAAAAGLVVGLWVAR